jgi:hypothetical protein
MSRRKPPPAPSPASSVASDRLAKGARHFDDHIIATLYAITKDPKAPASAKTSACIKLAELGYGKPAQARALTSADVEAMPDEQFETLWQAMGRFRAALPR